MSAESRSGFRIPVLDWIHDYRREWIKPDVIAGLTVAAVVIPKGMAYVTIASRSYNCSRRAWRRARAGERQIVLSVFRRASASSP
jgi:hypothetical protein